MACWSLLRSCGLGPGEPQSPPQSVGVSARLRTTPRVARSVPSPLGDDNLVGQEGVAVGEIQDRLVCQLLRVVRARVSLEDDHVIRIHHMKVTDPTAGDSVDVALDELGEFLMVLTDPEPPK